MELAGATSKHFGDHLSTFLETKQLTASHLAEATQLEPDFIRQLLAGTQMLTGDVALVLADTFETSPLSLLEVQRSYRLAVRDEETQ